MRVRPVVDRVSGDQIVRIQRIAALALLCPVALVLSACIGSPLLIAPEELPTGVEGTAYSQDLTTDGAGRETWSIEGGALAGGLLIGRTTGTIAGTPTASGTFTFTVRASTAGLPPRAGTREYTLTILPQLTLDATLDVARVGVPYDVTLATAGGVPPLQFAVVGLPAGLALDETDGTISGTPVNPYASLPLTVTVTDSGDPPQTVTEQATLVVKPEAVAITTTSLPDGQAGEVYSAQLAATGGLPPYAWAVQSGVLPDGLRLDLDEGTITGTPTAAATNTIVIRVTDADSPSSTDSVELTIAIVPRTEP